jgi:hypothetical protein
VFADGGLNNLVVLRDKLLNGLNRFNEILYWCHSDLSLTSRCQRLPERSEVLIGLPDYASFAGPSPFKLPAQFNTANAILGIK